MAIHCFELRLEFLNHMIVYDLFSINKYKPLITPGDFTKIHYGSLWFTHLVNLHHGIPIVDADSTPMKLQVNSSVSDDWGKKKKQRPNGAEAKTSRHLVPWPQMGISMYIYICI